MRWHIIKVKANIVTVNVIGLERKEKDNNCVMKMGTNWQHC